MKVLLISNVPLKMDNSMGNTLLNLLGNLENVELASIYTRSGTPDPEIADAFCITERMLIKNLLQKTPAGIRVQSPGADCIRHSETEDRKILRFVKSSRWTIFFWMQDLVWKLGRWKSPELEQFVKDFSPDIVLTVLINSACLNNLILHVLSLTQAKFILYAWDNNYSLKMPAYSPLRWIKRLIDRVSMRKVVQKAALFYVISDMQKEEYEKCFRRSCKVLTKGADFEEQPVFKEQYHDPLQLVFTGNIAMNRWKSLKMIADVLENINRHGIRAQLRIYTATPLTEKMKKALHRGESSILMGSVPAREIPEIQRNADILVHAEAFDMANRLRVRHSFSTKIVDYLKAARLILAVGPKNVASIDHLIRNDCAIIADNKLELEEKIRDILNDFAKLDSITRNAYDCGCKYHNKQDIQEMLLQDLNDLCEK